jgi:predicted amino acid racemase
MYLKPPATSYVKNVIKYADISLNSDYSTLQALDAEAKQQQKTHRVIIMIEMGELREGVVRENFLDFYNKVFDLPHIDIIGLPPPPGCMYGIEPSFDKLIQLCLYTQLIETKFNRKLPLVSGGSSITLPLLGKNKVPDGVNHLRIGEAAFLGTSPLTTKKYKNLSTSAFEFYGNIVELEKKELQPDGVIGEGNVGHAEMKEYTTTMNMEYKAILDFGVIDVDVDNIHPKDPYAKFVGTTSDLTVYSLGTNPRHHKSGKPLVFRPDYMAVARLMNSKFIEKQVV